MTVLEVTQFEGLWNTLVPAVGVLTTLALMFGAVAVFMLSRATGSDVQ